MFSRRPVLGILHEITGYQAYISLGIGEDAHNPGAAADLFIHSLQGVGRGDFP